jgi:hypothetical protein
MSRTIAQLFARARARRLVGDDSTTPIGGASRVLCHVSDRADEVSARSHSRLTLSTVGAGGKLTPRRAG